MKHSSFKVFLIHTLSGLLLCICGTILIRVQASKAQDLTGPPPFLPANSWMTIPMPWHPGGDPVPVSIRKNRNDYFDELIGLSTPLTSENAKTRQFSDGATLGSEPELPNSRNRAILIAQFVSYQPVLSNSGRAIYTEAQFRVLKVFEGVTGKPPSAYITVIIPGGTVKTETGAVISYLTRPRPYFINIGKTYLLVASLNNEGNFYMLAKDWDVSDGIVRPNFFATGSHSTLSGLNTQQLITTLEAQLGTHD